MAIEVIGMGGSFDKPIHELLFSVDQTLLVSLNVLLFLDDTLHFLDIAMQ
jgi:hypothetical protein